MRLPIPQPWASAVRSTAGVEGSRIETLAVDTTGSSVIPVDANRQPLDDYYLWCDHRVKREAPEISQAAASGHD